MKVEELIETLGHQDQDVRRGAARSLGEIGEDAKVAVPALIQAVQQDKHARIRAARALGRIGEGAKDAVSALIQALQDQDQYVRRCVAKALEKIGTPEALKVVEEYQSQR